MIILLINIDGKRCILFEKRSGKLDFQPGDVCLPGGGIKKGEQLHEAVLRESCEELLVEANQIYNISGPKILPGPYGRVVAVFTGEISKYDFTYSRDEVETVFAVPLEWFFYTKTTDKKYPVYDYEGFHIWGFTARVIMDYLKSIRQS